MCYFVHLITDKKTLNGPGMEYVTFIYCYSYGRSLGLCVGKVLSRRSLGLCVGKVLSRRSLELCVGGRF